MTIRKEGIASPAPVPEAVAPPAVKAVAAVVTNPDGRTEPNIARGTIRIPVRQRIDTNNGTGIGTEDGPARGPGIEERNRHRPIAGTTSSAMATVPVGHRTPQKGKPVAENGSTICTRTDHRERIPIEADGRDWAGPEGTVAALVEVVA